MFRERLGCVLKLLWHVFRQLVFDEFLKLVKVSSHFRCKIIKFCKAVLGRMVLMLKILTEMIIRIIFPRAYKLRYGELFLLKEFEFLLQKLLNRVLIFVNQLF